MSAPTFEHLYYGIPTFDKHHIYKKTPIPPDDIKVLQETYHAADNIIDAANSGVTILGSLTSKLGMADIELSPQDARDVGYLFQTLGELLAATDNLRANVEYVLHGRGYDTCRSNVTPQPCACDSVPATATTTARKITQARELVRQAISSDEIKHSERPLLNEAINKLSTAYESEPVRARAFLEAALMVSTDRPASRRMVNEAAYVLSEEVTA